MSLTSHYTESWLLHTNLDPLALPQPKLQVFSTLPCHSRIDTHFRLVHNLLGCSYSQADLHQTKASQHVNSIKPTRHQAFNYNISINSANSLGWLCCKQCNLQPCHHHPTTASRCSRHCLLVQQAHNAQSLPVYSFVSNVPHCCRRSITCCGRHIKQMHQQVIHAVPQRPIGVQQ
jgi:hypothetical protein